MWTWTRLTPSRQARLHRFGEQPAAVALAGQLGNQADEGELAFVRLAEVELEHADFAAALVDDRVKLDLRVLDDRGEMRVVHDQPREPQPGRADEAEQLAVMLGLRHFDRGSGTAASAGRRWSGGARISR